ncbi:hypothetical protein CPB86DRAFT_748504 [Serendipita vermifera]|nr:hypothetical protein CPB86DRAFT_748504 [Serendipita vermifera]
MNVHIPNSIQTLLIESAGLLKRLIASPNIRNLEVRLLVWRADFMVTKTQDAFMDLTEWPALEVATLQSNYSRLVGTSFSSLRKITLKSLPYFTKFDTNITLFIKEIAEVVDRYPCLEEIYMDECPEWDILVIMLERRNILAVPIIKPIRRLSLPSTCPSSVSQLLPGLLAGKWVQRPSNFELSQAGNANSILNSAKSGCFACLRILRKCDTPLKAADPADYGDEFMSKMQDYPHSEDEILATWQKRTELWEYVYKLEGRLTRCNTQETCKLMKTFDAGSSPLISLPRENQPQTGMPSTRVDSADSASPIPPLAAEYLSQTSMPSILIDSTDFPSPSRSSLFTRLKKLGKSTMKPFKGD